MAESIPTIDISARSSPPAWAVKQRHLIDAMERAAGQFVDKYARPDGTLIWREQWPGMDGSDDGYESFTSFPLFYLLGGGDHILELAHREWDAVTRQFATYGQVEREFDAYYDWMHHGESSTYIYNLALADPHHAALRRRLAQFAAMYAGDDPAAPNWDARLKAIRSPINGSRGPRFRMTADDWVTHRPVLADYLSPYEDVPGHPLSHPLAALDWNDDETFAAILKLMNERMVPGDVPLNLNATSLVTCAFLSSGEEKYRRWVLDYLSAWVEHTRRNGGITPDNVGPSGKIGERMNGKWWGGYYGWRWPHGAWIILESTLIAGENATLLTGDSSWLNLHRSQADLLWSLRNQEGGDVKVPARYGDTGWFDYQQLQTARDYIHAWFMSQGEDDLQRLQERFPTWEAWRGRPGFFKAGGYAAEGWFTYQQGKNAAFPDQVLDDTYAGMNQRLNEIDADDLSKADEWDVHHWQDLNPVIPEGLIQMAMGTPGAVYHGGLMHASVRYFDPVRRCPGLPPHVAALVEHVAAGEITLTLVNTDALAGHDVVVQAGGFGEHMFLVAHQDGDPRTQPVPVNGRHLCVRLGPSANARLNVGMKRFGGQPTHEMPPFA